MEARENHIIASDSFPAEFNHFKIDDIVGRKEDDYKIPFKVVGLNDEKAIIKGLWPYRLEDECLITELQLYSKPYNKEEQEQEFVKKYGPNIINPSYDMYIKRRRH